MIHRYEVRPPATTIKIWSSPESQLSGLTDFDAYIEARMTGGRDELGEFHGPCIIMIDDETERGRWELEQIEGRLAAGKLPAVRPYEPEVGLSDDQIEALVERRAQELLRERGHVEQPSEEAVEVLRDAFEDAERAAQSPQESYQGPVIYGGPIEVREVPAQVVEVEVARDGRKRCPLDKRLFKAGVAWHKHWKFTQDAEHQRLAAVMTEPAA